LVDGEILQRMVMIGQGWKKLGGPVKIGLVLGFVGALLTVVGLLAGNLAPLSMRSLVLGILLGGGSWGVVSWAVASAAADAMEDSEEMR
jgi:hypothetical protein